MADYARNRMFFASSTMLMLTVAGYMSISLFWLGDLPEGWRVPLTCLLFLLSQSITAMRVFVTWKPDLPFALLRFGGFLASVFMILSWLDLLRDAGLALLFGTSFLFPCAAPLRDAVCSAALSVPALWAMLSASLAITGIGMYAALRVPPIVEKRVALRGLPPELEGLRIAQLSDLHIGSTFSGNWLEQVVRRTNAARPDIVAITGDIADGSPARIAEAVFPLARLEARHGVFLSVGNHDYYSGLKAWVHTWRGWGLDVLINEHRSLEVRGRRVVIAGVTDPCAALFRSLHDEMGPPDIRKALADAPEGLRILLAHRPGDAEQNAASGIRLQLSGHTHGGQFFFLFPLVSRLNRGFRSGLYRVGPLMLHVSPGTGMWGYVPMRIGSHAEISLLVLTSEHATDGGA